MYGEMGYMGEELRTHRRKHPEELLENIHTIISLAMPYTPPASTQPASTQGVISSYAHGDDYHDLMKKRLKAMARDLDNLLGTHGQRVFVDTAPVLEHALAESSGLAWHGKHSLSINRKLGSWFFLAEIFTTAEIEPDKKASAHCGSCTACISDCPTQAIVAPYVVDARLCISYLTIEYSGFIPVSLRKAMGNRIYGCDDCQLVCPWNRKATPPTEDLLKPRKDTFLPELANLLTLDDEGFRTRFRKSPVKRTGRTGLLRNVCIAMGNSGNPSFVPLLLESLDDEALIRGHAVWALSMLAADDPVVIDKVKALQQQEQNPDVQAEIADFMRMI